MAVNTIGAGVILNEGSIDVDFRVESNGSANMLLVDGGNEEVLIQRAASGGTATAGSVLIVEDDDNAEISLLGGSSSLLAINFGHSGDVDDGMITYNTTSGSEAMQFTTNGAIRTTIDKDGKVGIGISSSITDPLHVKTTAAETRISLESSTGKWAIGAEDGDKFGILNYGTSTPFIIDSSGKVGIGTTSPASVSTGISNFAPKLDIRGGTGTGVATAGAMILSTAETTIVDGDYLGMIAFQAPLEGSDGDAILSPASIHVEAEGAFDGATNSASIVFSTADSTVPIERMRIHGEGNVIIAGGELHNSSGEFTFRNTTDGENISFRTQAANTERLKIHSGGNVEVKTGNLVIGTSGKGISFAATSDATGMTSELLDDYEEGTFTPAIGYQNATGVSLDYATDGFQVGRYTKIGNVVHARFSIQVDISGSPVNDNISITGLPYTSINVTNLEGAGVADQLNITGKANYVLAMGGNSTQAGMILSSISGNQGDEIGTGDNYRFNGGITYLTA
ncbi:hypothetical protein N9990_00075 [bacterium]|nr:hypothetical protein [bacterium]